MDVRWAQALIRAIYVEEGEPGRLDAPNGTIAAVAICAILVLLMGLWPQPFMDASFQAAKSFGSNIVRLPVHPIAWRSRGS